MTRLASWGSVALALAFSSTAIAQTAPDQNVPDPDRDIDVDVDVDADVDRDLDRDTTTPMQTPGTTTPGTTTTPGMDRDIDLDVDVDSDFDPNRGAGTGTLSAPDAGMYTPPPPPPVDTQSTGYVAAPVYYGTDADMEEDKGGPFSRVGVAIAAGGGTGGFINDTLRGTTNVGGEWNVRATVGTRSPIAFEGSYIGSAQGINALGLDDDALLVGNGVQGALRLNATVDLPVQPFIYGGAAWRRYSLRNTATNLSDVADSDDVLEIPVGVGIAGRYRGLMLDLRGEYRAARNADLLPEFGNDDPLIDINNTDSASMNRWGAKASVGFEF